MSPQLLSPAHPLRRRAALMAGGAGILGLGVNHLSALRQLAADEGSPAPHQPKAVIYIFVYHGEPIMGLL